MHLILGGRCMGKRKYAEKLYLHFDFIYDLENDNPENIRAPGLILNLHIGIKKLIMKNVDPLQFFMSRLEILKSCVIIGDEICGGVVPIDEFSRKWRDETGRVYQFLAQNADIVDRVFAGLALRLKGQN